jgi:hypothetical protein
MWKLERILLCALVIGVWALVLNPLVSTAHHGGHSHDCDGTGYGQVDGDDVYVYRLDITCD